MQDIFDRHERIALQFSGGRDSLACLYLLRPYWDKLTVYWCDTGAAYPETVALMQQVRGMVPNFAVIEGRQPKVVAEFGIPSDIVPVNATPIGRFVGGEVQLIQDRYSCCIRSMIQPTLERMIADGITLIIRGQKSQDRLKSMVRSGDVHEGIEYWFPIEDWDMRKVMHFLSNEGAPIPRFYDVLNSMPDCMTCSAYWEEGAMAYLKRYHHKQFLDNRERLEIINKAVGEHIAAFNKEVAL
ncbi:CysH 3'-phosphoadenosine 5'-phosphosulfate sulfotransferase (PAPS reductase)/FAD synthetase and related enzymes [uncultured Caudovirales phage]|uniref:CysH 3'-phosphoadenosine 5'-phosphosulfate sulfotransferase (PAPS reductase)/FAD synthetase and related enzymes n=1 Tax=uncultured Caudovirales phage TaxID=2100421 RepID=A0A6J5LJJ6_9CAUD|nr:CysH 3'-phosphoadenosine 5'-phosphosulfate sulfotransferase (PAPS reductase)/FAD synthetase and related enzymes [uncultured Caudovirales phage]